MKHYFFSHFLIIAIFCLSSFSFAQKIYTKDGVFIGVEEDFIDACVESSQNKSIEFAGKMVGMESYCYCAVTKIFTNITSDELVAASSQDKMIDMMMSEPHLSVLMECLEEHVTYDDDLDLSYLREDEMIYEVALKACAQEILNDEETRELWNKETAGIYCNCALTGLLDRGVQYKDLLKLEDVDGLLFNEVIIPCATESLSLATDEVEEYDLVTISGDEENCVVNLTKSVGETFKVKLKVGGIEKYFLVDTGASMLILNEQFIDELIETGAIEEYTSFGSHPFALANNEIVTAEMMLIPTLQIGCYQLEGVMAAILPSGSLICGVEFLDLFDNWSIDRKKKQLLLTK